MGVFLEPLNNPFINLSDTPQIIVETDNVDNSNYLYIQSIKITNLTAQTIRINLQRVTNADSPVLIINQIEIEPLKPPVNLIDFLGTTYLKYNLSPALTEKLICYSNGYTQIFNCVVDYSKITELPIPPTPLK